jgi:hypothetical protein
MILSMRYAHINGGRGGGIGQELLHLYDGVEIEGNPP